MQERAVGIRRGDRFFQELRRQTGRDGAQGVDGRFGIAKSGSRRQAFQLFAPAKRVEQSNGLEVPRLRRLAQRTGDGLHGRALGGHFGVEGRQGRKSKRRPQARPWRLFPGKAMALGARRHLHPVFEPAPKPVRFQQRPRFPVRQQPRQQQARERSRRIALTQIGPLAGVQQLQRLHHHLHVADPTRPELHVEPRLAERAGGVGRIAEQRPQTAHVVDGPRVDAAGIDEGLENGEELLPEGPGPGGGTRPQPGLPLPGSSEGFVVGLGRRQRIAERAIATFGAQPQVDPEDHAVRGRLLDGGAHHPGQLGEVLVQRVLARRAAVGRIEVADVDVRREVELVPAELPHGHHYEPGALAALLERLAPLPGQVAASQKATDSSRQASANPDSSRATSSVVPHPSSRDPRRSIS